MGAEQVTVQNLEIVKIDADLNLIAVRGAIPGPNGGIVYVKNTTKAFREKHEASSRISTNPQKRSARG
jgi:large subunit ribosomal protein L3